MSDETNIAEPVNGSAPAIGGPAFVWGAEEIGAVIERSTRQVHHLLAKNRIRSARKVGGRWMASRVALLREFGAGHV